MTKPPSPSPPATWTSDSPNRYMAGYQAGYPAGHAAGLTGTLTRPGERYAPDQLPDKNTNTGRYRAGFGDGWAAGWADGSALRATKPPPTGRFTDTPGWRTPTPTPTTTTTTADDGGGGDDQASINSIKGESIGDIPADTNPPAGAVMLSPGSEIITRSGQVRMIYCPAHIQILPATGGGWVIRRWTNNEGADPESWPRPERAGWVADTLTAALQTANRWARNLAGDAGGREWHITDEDGTPICGHGLEDTSRFKQPPGDERVIPEPGHSKWEDYAAYWRNRALRAEGGQPGAGGDDWEQVFGWQQLTQLDIAHLPDVLRTFSTELFTALIDANNAIDDAIGAEARRRVQIGLGGTQPTTTEPPARPEQNDDEGPGE